jgi:pimeloyl-ACP methyl ester carboxylesterase
VFQSTAVHPMSHTPYPFEVTLESGITLRGLEYAQDGPPVVLVHDLGGDADSWRDIPPSLVTGGFRAINLELRGHGLSDGDADPETTLADLGEALGIISGSFGPLGIMAYGTVATLCFALGGDQGVPVHVLVSPLPSEGFDPGSSTPATRAIFAGTRDDEVDSFIRGAYQKLAGQNMWFSTGIPERGVGLLTTKPHMVEQLTTFLRRYLIGFHLAWISQQTEGQGDQKRG